MAAFSNTASLKASSALKEFSTSRELSAQRHEMGTGSAQGRPRNMYKRSASESSSATMYMRGKEHTLPKEHHGLLRTLSYRDSPERPNHLLGVFNHQGLIVTLRARTGPRPATRHRWRFIVATTHALSYGDSSMC